jgi:hypothetical protein
VTKRATDRNARASSSHRGSAKATYASPGPEGPPTRPPPVAVMTTNCRPPASYTAGAAVPAKGSFAAQSSAPVSASKARIFSSSVPATKTRPPAVTVAPPRFCEPVFGTPLGGERRQFAERGAPENAAGAQIVAVEQAPGRLDAGVALVVDEELESIERIRRPAGRAVVRARPARRRLVAAEEVIEEFAAFGVSEDQVGRHGALAGAELLQHLLVGQPVAQAEERRSDAEAAAVGAVARGRSAAGSVSRRRRAGSAGSRSRSSLEKTVIFDTQRLEGDVEPPGGHVDRGARPLRAAARADVEVGFSFGERLEEAVGGFFPRCAAPTRAPRACGR